MKGSRTSHAGELVGVQARCPATIFSRILVIDDDIVLRLLRTAVLIRSGYQVDTAKDGETGWEALQTKNYDLLMSDNNVSKVSGVELVKPLRFEEGYRTAENWRTVA